MKESLKRIITWAAKHFTHDKSRVPDISMSLTAVSAMALPAVQTMAKEDEVVMKDWMKNFRPVRQRTGSLYRQLSTLSPSKQNFPMWSLIWS